MVPSNGCSDNCPPLPCYQAEPESESAPESATGSALHAFGQLSLVIGFLSVVVFVARAWCVQPRRIPVFRAQRLNDNLITRP